MPARRREALHEHVAALFIGCARAVHYALGTVERRDGRVLHGQEHAVVHVGFERPEVLHDVLVADTEADARAREAVGLRERVELHAHVLRARIGKEAAALPAVEYELTIGVVVQHDDVVLFREGDELLVPAVRCQHRRRVVRIGDNHELRTARHVLGDIRELDEIVVLLLHGHIIDVRLRDFRAVRKNRIAGIRHQCEVALVEDGETDMCQSLLRAHERADLRLRVKLHAVAARIPLTHRLQQLRQVTQRVEIALRLHGLLGQLRHHGPGRRDVRRTDGEVDDLLPRGELRPLHGREARKDALPELLHTCGKLHDMNSSPE